MKNPAKSQFTFFINMLQPWNLLAGFFCYFFGVGLVENLGKPLDWLSVFLGLAILSLLQISSYLLKSYFDLLEKRGGPIYPKAGDENEPAFMAQVSPQPVLFGGISTLSVAAVLCVLLFSRSVIHPSAIILLGAAFILGFVNAVPPLRLMYSGYGELIEAILLANLFPALGYAIQTGEIHRLVPMLTFPLTGLCVSMFLGLSFRSFAKDVKAEKGNMLVRMGWQPGMFWHNTFILLAYTLLVGSIFLGVPSRLIFPGLATLPLGIYQVIQMVQIGRGAKPRWRILDLNARAIFFLTVYLIAYSLWMG